MICLPSLLTLFPVMLTRICSLFAILSLVLAGCRGTRSAGGVLPREKFVETYVSLLKQEATAGADSLGRAEKILKAAGVSAEQIRQSAAEYGRDLKQWQAFFREAAARLEEPASKAPSKIREHR